MTTAPAPGSAAADLRLLAAAIAAPPPLTWLVTGDSISQGLVHTHGGRSFSEHLHELIRGELGRRRDAVVNSAVSGNRIADLLDDWSRRVVTWEPDVVILMIGTNDSSTDGEGLPCAVDEYMDALREFARRTRSLGALPVLQTPPPVDPLGAPERARLNDYAASMREVTATDDVLLVDQHARFLALGDGTLPRGLMADAFHPNAAGHAALALTLVETLRITPVDGHTVPFLEAQVTAALS